jgi:hypothetical protein
MDYIIHFVDAQGRKQKETRHTTAEMRDFVHGIKPPAKLITVFLGDRELSGIEVREFKAPPPMP